MNRTCKNCVYFSVKCDYGVMSGFGFCSHTAFRNALNSPIPTGQDVVFVDCGFQEDTPFIYVGPEFGCIHWVTIDLSGETP